jgi:cytochrome c oxidase cbb3-type subunit 3
MKTRTPISIYIATTIGLTIMAFEMFASDSGYFSSPFFWALILIAIILLLIMNSIGDLIENENFSKLSEEEKNNIWKKKKFLIIRNFGTLLSKSSLLQKKKIF